MHTLTHETLRSLATLARPPCLSLYQPTHRTHPDNRGDAIRFRQNVDALQDSLLQAYPQADVNVLLAPLHELADDPMFWNHTLDGLAVLTCSATFRVFLLPRTVPELVVAADSFHVKPLRRFLQSTEPYQVLCLSRDKAKLFEGNRYGLVEVDLADQVPRTATEALGDQLTEPEQTVSSHGGTGQGTSPLVHSSGGKKEAVDLDADRYFRALDRALMEHHSRPGGLPLLLAALPEHHHRFQQISHNPLLLAKGLEINPEALDAETLSQSVWAVLEPQHRADQQARGEAFSAARAKKLGSDDLQQVAHAAAQGRVSVLLIEEELHIAGRLNTQTGDVELAELADPRVDDVLDDLAELVQSKGGKIYVFASERMPTNTGLAATFRH